MTREKIDRLINQIQKLMYGLNYEVTLGIEILEDCVSFEDINYVIKMKFPKTTIESITFIPVTEQDFWDDINEKFDYRGDGIGSYLKLTTEKETALKLKQNDLRKFISKYIIKDTNIYSYPFLEGIPGYPVYWEYSFVLLNPSGNSLFIYGSSSD